MPGRSLLARSLSYFENFTMPFSAQSMTRWVLLSSILVLPACQNPNPLPSPTPNGSASPSASPASSPTASPERVPQDLCYTVETSDVSGQARIFIDSDRTVTGETRATIQNPDEGYYSSYTQELSGKLGDNSDLILDVTTRIENDVQKTEETWLLTGTALQAEQLTYEPADCDELSESSSEAPPSEAPASPQAAGTRIEFAAGSTSSQVKNSVVRGTRNIYLLNAAAGQTMRLNISSLENNAVFEVIGPNGTALAQEEEQLTLELPASGDYQVIVGGTRGNASYTLDVTIE